MLSGILTILKNLRAPAHEDIKPYPKRPYLRLEHEGEVEKDDIILSDGKIVHHDRSRQGDREGGCTASLGVQHKIMQKGRPCAPSEPHQLSCRRPAGD